MNGAGAGDRPWRALALLVVGVLLLYANTLSNGYHLDDFYRIANNPEIRYVGNPLRHFADPSTSATLPTIVQYRPLMPLTLSLGRALLEPLGIPSLAVDHLGNIGIHAFICLMVFAWTRHLFEQGDVEQPHRPALWVALLYAVHPVAGSPVNYLCARDLLLMQALALASLVSWGRFRDGGGARWAGTALLCMALSMCAKQNGAVLPLLVLAYELLVRRADPRDAKTYAGPFAYMLVVAAFAFLTIKVLGFSDLDKLKFERPRFEYPATMARVHWAYYLRNALWPFAMRPLPDLEVASNFSDWRSLFGAGAILYSLFMAWRLRLRAPLVAFAICAYWIMFAVTSSIRPFRFIAMDYRQVPSLPYLLMLAVLAVRTWVPSRARTEFLALLVAYFTVSSFAINFTWKSEESLWGNAVRLGTRAQGEVNYAISQRGKRPEAARAHLLKSMDEGENNIFSLINLGLVELDLGEQEAGLVTIRRATEIAPGRSLTHYWYARALKRTKRGDEAIESAQRAAELEPQNTRYPVYAARLLLQAGRFDEAQAELDDAGRQDSEVAKARRELAAARAGE